MKRIVVTFAALTCAANVTNRHRNTINGSNKTTSTNPYKSVSGTNSPQPEEIFFDLTAPDGISGDFLSGLGDRDYNDIVVKFTVA